MTMKRPHYILFDQETQAIIWGYQRRAIQRMLDFDYVCGRRTPSIACVIDPTQEGFHKCFYGAKEILIPIHRTLERATGEHPEADVVVNFASFRSAYSTSREALEAQNIRTVAIIAEGVPEQSTKELIHVAEQGHKWIIGPATVGGIAAGAFRIGNTAGTIDNIIGCRLHRAGSVGYVSKSGGLSNELNNIISRNTDGVNEGIAIGGDRYPGSTFIQHLLRFEANPGIAMMVMLGEVGGPDEYEVVRALEQGRITKPVVAWCIGTCSKVFPAEVQFGHAGARAGAESETADAKNEALRQAGAIVPQSFDDFDASIHDTYEALVDEGRLVPQPDIEPPRIPVDYGVGLREGLIRRPTEFITTISDDRGEEPRYCGVTISEVVEQDYGLGGVLGLLWFKTALPKWAAGFLEKVILIVADHGPAVSGAHNAIVAARAGKDLVSSLASGLLTIGPRFGGAVNDAAHYFTTYLHAGRGPEYMVSDMKAKGKYIPGIGHRIKSVQNPDRRVELLKAYAMEHFPMTPYLGYALAVESLTTAKRDNLILNVDGCIGILSCDMLRSIGYSAEEVEEFIALGVLNAFFVLGRSIGIMGHVMDQNRLRTRLYRQPWDEILFMMPDKPEEVQEG